MSSTRPVKPTLSEDAAFGPYLDALIGTVPFGIQFVGPCDGRDEIGRAHV